MHLQETWLAIKEDKQIILKKSKLLGTQLQKLKNIWGQIIILRKIKGQNK